jgi:hypothetical protein
MSYYLKKIQELEVLNRDFIGMVENFYNTGIIMDLDFQNGTEFERKRRKGGIFGARGPCK